MRIATFLHLKTGRNIFKPVIPPATLVYPPLKAVEALKSMDPEAVYIGPRGGHYRLDAKGRKIYLKAV